jgi:hypothetical protein
MTIVRVKNRQDLHWPPWKCACCGGAFDKIETATRVEYKKYEDHITRRWVQVVPSCAACKQHQMIAAGASDWYTAGCAAVVLAIGLVMVGAGVHRMPGGLWWMLLTVVVAVLGYGVLVSMRIKRNRNAAKEYMKPKCTGATFVRYRREPPKPAPVEFTDIFVFSNDDYAAEFCELNAGSLQRHVRGIVSPQIPEF